MLLTALLAASVLATQDVQAFAKPLLSVKEGLYDAQLDVVDGGVWLRMRGVDFPDMIITEGGPIVKKPPTEVWRSQVDFAPQSIHINYFGMVAALGEEGPLVFFDNKGAVIKRWEYRDFATEQRARVSGKFVALSIAQENAWLTHQGHAIWQGTVVNLTKYAFELTVNGEKQLYDPKTGKRHSPQP